MKLMLLLSLASLTSAFAQDAKSVATESDAIKAIAAGFCTEVRRERIEGLPAPEQLRRLSSFITPQLHAAIERARALQKEQMSRRPDDKPDWIEGDLFSSSFEGVTSWELGEVFTAPSVDATVKVLQSYVEAGQKPVTWTDTLVFMRQGKRWLVNEILMGGKWSFGGGGTLRGRLPGGIQESHDHTSPDGRWRVTFLREGDDLKRVTITDNKGRSSPVVLFGDKADAPCTFPTWLIWSPDGGMLALRPGDNPRFTSTLVYRLKDEKWMPVTLPRFYAEERKTIAANGFREREDINDAAYWQDDRTLVVHYFGEFTNGDDSDGFDKLISVRIDDKGQGVIVESVDAPGGN